MMHKIMENPEGVQCATCINLWCAAYRKKFHRSERQDARLKEKHEEPLNHPIYPFINLWWGLLSLSHFWYHFHIQKVEEEIYPNLPSILILNWVELSQGKESRKEGMAVKLYGTAMSTCTSRVLACLYEIGVDFEPMEVNLRAGEHKQPSYLATKNVRHQGLLFLSISCANCDWWKFLTLVSKVVKPLKFSQS